MLYVTCTSTVVVELKSVDKFINSHSNIPLTSVVPSASTSRVNSAAFEATFVIWDDQLFKLSPSQAIFLFFKDHVVVQRGVIMLSNTNQLSP